jgi:flagellar basal-body rod protein FlgG
MSLRALQTAVSGIVSPSRGLDVVANNLANLHTPGFKTGRANFQDMVYQQMAGAAIGTGSTISGANARLEPGPTTQTGRELDVAIDGPGFLQVIDGSGQSLYTRSGNLTTNARGELTLPGGYRLDPSIQIPALAGPVSIASDGTVSATVDGKPTVLGQIERVTFRNPEGLARMGDNLFAITGASGDAMNAGSSSGSIRQGYLESSNVDMVDELTTLIQLQQAFQVNSQVIQAANERLQMLRDLRA